MSTITLSVIIPHYNDFERLKRCIASCPRREDIEVIVIDDQSEEETQKRLKAYVDSLDDNIRLFFNLGEKHNAGICRNIGMSHANGKWITFADADDFYLEGALELIEDYFAQDYDIVYFNTTSVLEGTEIESNRHWVTSRQVETFCKNPGEVEEFILRMSVPPWAKLIRKEVIDKNHIQSEEIRYSNDVMLSTLIGYYAKKITADMRTLYCITDSEGSLTKVKDKECLEIRNQAFLRRYIFLFKHIDKNLLKRCGYQMYGIRSVLNPIKHRYGINVAMNNMRKLRQEKVPLIF